MLCRGPAPGDGGASSDEKGWLQQRRRGGQKVQTWHLGYPRCPPAHQRSGSGPQHFSSTQEKLLGSRRTHRDPTSYLPSPGGCRQRWELPGHGEQGKWTDISSFSGRDRTRHPPASLPGSILLGKWPIAHPVQKTRSCGWQCLEQGSPPEFDESWSCKDQGRRSSKFGKVPT